MVVLDHPVVRNKTTLLRSVDTDMRLFRALVHEISLFVLYEATRLLATAFTLLAPAHWKAELANVVWKAAVFHGIATERCVELLQLAESLPISSVDVAELWRGAVGRAV